MNIVNFLYYMKDKKGTHMHTQDGYKEDMAKYKEQVKKYEELMERQRNK